LTEEEKQQIRDKKQVNAERLDRAFAHLYLGQRCPLRNEECVGPACMMFLRQVEGDKIVNGNCSINILAMNLAPIGAGLMELAARSAGAQPGDMQRLIVPGQTQ
jgi:hypothetical protein